MDINYELYKVFYHVAESLSFSEASRRLYISQSAVSQSIKTLEKKLGQTLFFRNTKKVSLTPAGELLQKHIEPAVRLISQGEEQLCGTDLFSFDRIHIAASDTICRYFMVPYLKQFHEIYPRVSVRITNAPSLSCAELLTQGKVDLIISNYPNNRLNPDFIVRYLAEFSDVFVANPNDFPDAAETLSLKEISRHPILMLDKNSTTSRFLHQLFLNHQLELAPEFQLHSNDLLIDLARIGLGIAFVPDYCIRSKDCGLTVIKTKETLPRRRMAAAINPSLPMSPSLSAFLDLLPAL